MKRLAMFLSLASSLSPLVACGGGGGSGGGGGVATHFSVASPANIPSGTTLNFTVTALDANNNVTNYSGTLHFTTSTCSPRGRRPPGITCSARRTRGATSSPRSSSARAGRSHSAP